MVSFGESYVYFCAVTFFISCIFNGVLIYVVHKRQEHVGFYRFFTYAFVFIDVLYSFAFSAVQPFWYAGPGTLGFFSIAPWSSNFTLTQAIRTHSEYEIKDYLDRISSLVRIVYSRIALCLHEFRLQIRLVMQLILIAWLINANYILLAESLAVRQILQDNFAAEYGVDLLHSYLLTVDVNDEVLATRSTIGTGISMTLMQSQIIIIVFCGLRIHWTIKRRTMSGNLKQIHGRALSMLISQALNPVLFLYVPSFIIMFGMFMDKDFGDLPKGLAMVLALFPIINPVIVIYFTEDYKRYLLNNGRASTTQASIVMSKAVESRII